MKKQVLLGLVGVSVLAAGMVYADGKSGRHGEHEGRGQMFSQIDANGDGQITSEEIETHRAARFAEQDANGDGVISKDELVAAMMARMEGRMHSMADRILEMHDENGDGVIGQDELPGDGFGKMFAELDKDGDGAISQDEFSEMKGPREGGRGGHRGGMFGRH